MHMIHNHLIKNKQAGLTIVESLVAISILVVAVIGPLVIVSQALRTSFFARDQMTSFFLAQEAIENIRNIRDRNSLTETNPSNWLNGIVTGVSGMPVITNLDGTGIVKYNLTRGAAGYELQACPANVCPKLNINKSTGIYGDSAGSLESSIYTREIVFYKAPGDTAVSQEVTVEVTMSWNQVGGVYQFKLRENLTNWKIQNYDVN